MQTQSANTAVAGSASVLPGVTLVSSGPEVVQLKRVNLRSLLEAQGDLIVSLDFIKADNTERTLTGRRGVTSYLKGGSNNVEAPNRPYITMFDLGLCQYRAVNLDTVSAVRAGGRVYDVID